MARDHPAMPAEHGGRRDEETRPAGPGKDTARSRKKRLVSIAEFGAADLATQDREFIA